MVTQADYAMSLSGKWILLTLRSPWPASFTEQSKQTGALSQNSQNRYPYKRRYTKSECQVNMRAGYICPLMHQYRCSEISLFDIVSHRLIMEIWNTMPHLTPKLEFSILEHRYNDTMGYFTGVPCFVVKWGCLIISKYIYLWQR